MTNGSTGENNIENNGSNRLDNMTEVVYNSDIMVVTTAREVKRKAVSVKRLLDTINLDQSRVEPLHSQLRDSLVRLFETGEFDGMAFVPERSLAEGLGVSRVTVRRALDDLRREGRLTRQVGRGSVVRSISGSHVAHAVSGTAGKPSVGIQSVGLIGFSWKSEFVRETVSQLTASCQNRGLGLRLHRADFDTLAGFADTVATPPDETAFMLFAGERGGRHLYEQLNSRGYKTVSIDLMSDYYVGDNVSTDSRESIRMGLDHLVGFGHQRIVLLVNEFLRDESVLAKVEEFKHEAAVRGLTGRVVVCGTEGIEDGYNSAYRYMPEVWMGGGEWAPTAIMTVSDPGAWAVLKWLRENGVSVPGDVSVVGFENAHSSEHVMPPLTTIAHPIFGVVEHALDLLLTDHEEPRRVLVSPTLVVRESTGQARRTFER